MFYVMTPMSDPTNSVIYTPVENTAVPMRPLMSRDEIDALVLRIPSLPILEIVNEKQRKDVYKSALASVDPDLYVRLLKTVYQRRILAKAKRKRLPELDNDYETITRRSLYTELSLVLGIDHGEVEAYLTERIENASAV